jgi:hypothetical protein
MSCQSSSFISEQLSIYCRLCSLEYLEWVIMNTIVFTEVPGVSDHVCNCVHWSTWSEWSWIRLCSLKYLEWVIMYTIWSLTPGTSVNTIVFMITHSRYFSEHNRIHDHSLQVLQWTQSYSWSLTPGTSVNTNVYILKYLEWVIMYTIVSTEVPRVSDHVYDCVHWSTWSEWSCILFHSSYFSEDNRIQDRPLQVLQWTQ